MGAFGIAKSDLICYHRYVFNYAIQCNRS